MNQRKKKKTGVGKGMKFGNKRKGGGLGGGGT